MRGFNLIASDTKEQLILLRTYKEEDKHYILSTWLRNLYRYNSFYRLFDQDAYYYHYDQVLKSLLSNTQTNTKIICLREDPDTILGYSVSSPQTLHFIFIRGRWRGEGLMKDLLPDDLNAFTHLTEIGEKIWKKKYPKLKFNPFLI